MNGTPGGILSVFSGAVRYWVSAMSLSFSKPRGTGEREFSWWIFDHVHARRSGHANKNHATANLRASGHFQPAHCPRRGGKLVRFQAHALQHRNEKIRQRIIVLHVEGEVLAM